MTAVMVGVTFLSLTTSAMLPLFTTRLSPSSTGAPTAAVTPAGAAGTTAPAPADPAAVRFAGVRAAFAGAGADSGAAPTADGANWAAPPPLDVPATPVTAFFACASSSRRTSPGAAGAFTAPAWLDC